MLRFSEDPAHPPNGLFFVPFSVPGLGGATLFLELQLRHGDAVDLVGAVGEAQGTGARPEVGEGEVVGDAGAAVRLDGTVEDAQGDVRGYHLYHGDLGPRFLAADGVHHVRSLEG